MTIKRIESLAYGVSDVATAVRYFEDIGLEKLDSGNAGADFRTVTHQTVLVRRIDDASLPVATEDGPTMRETVWGVDSAQALEAIAAELVRDRDVQRSPDGSLHSRDESGFALGFALTRPNAAVVEAPQVNAYQTSVRVNARFERRTRPRPTRIGHVVYRIRNEGREKASSFYLDRLGFRLTDRSLQVGDFMRLPGTGDHHQLLHMWIRQTSFGFDHAALEVPSMDDVLWSGGYMNARGWKGTWGPGRQSLGSHMFWHFENPCGGELEFFTDMDRFDDSWQSKVWEPHTTPAPPWMIGDSPAGAPRPKT